MNWLFYSSVGRLSSSRNCHTIVMSIRDGPELYDTEVDERVGQVVVEYTVTDKASRQAARKTL
jgi:hypothetical protein